MILVYAPGVFDLLHVGHLHFLYAARGLGDRLIVGIPTDEVVFKDKGQKPVIPCEDRARLLRSLSYVNGVMDYNGLDFRPHLQLIKPDILAVGEEWGPQEHHIKAERWCRDHSCRVVKIPRYPGESTTAIKQRIRESKP